MALPEATTSAAEPPAISGGKQTHLFEVRSGVPVIINGLILKDGYNATGNGGAIDNAGLLTIQACLLTNNRAANGDGGTGSVQLLTNKLNLINYKTINQNPYGGGLVQYNY